MLQDIILTQGVRVLTPTEYELLKGAMLTQDQKDLISNWKKESESNPENAAYYTAKIYKMERYPIVCDAALYSGMRLVELSQLKPEQYRPARRLIAEVGCGKKLCDGVKRNVLLPLEGCDAIDRFLRSGLPVMEGHAMNAALVRYAEKAGIGTTGICGKMFRKTWVSWLMAIFPEREMYISASMGHTRATLQKHYLGFGFQRVDLDKMRNGYCKGWGITE